jgi:deazaflavin-dependent oxidoreductase (nitroreductase family)
VPNDDFLAWLTATLPDSAVRFSGRFQAAVYRLSNGRIGGRFARAQVLVLTTTGRNSGEPRSTALLYGEDGDRLVVVGSNTGSDRAPAWALNLAAEPEATVQRGRQRLPIHATEVKGEERARLWNLMNAQYQGFDKYTERTQREFKVFVLESSQRSVPK